MTAAELDQIEARAKAALTYERSRFDETDQVWETASSGEDTAFPATCPLCGGEGEIDGQRYDSKETYAATVVAYGIGKGLQLAEEWVETAPADILRLVAEVRRLQDLVDPATANQCDGCQAGIPVDENNIHRVPYPSGSMKCEKGKYR